MMCRKMIRTAIPSRVSWLFLRDSVASPQIGERVLEVFSRSVAVAGPIGRRDKKLRIVGAQNFGVGSVP
jgi:hypothetical protein